MVDQQEDEDQWAYWQSILVLQRREDASLTSIQENRILFGTETLNAIVQYPL